MRTDQVRFPLKLSGKSVKRGRIALEDLVPALTALSEMVRVACRIEFGTDDYLRIEAEATGEGSFVVDLILSQVPHVVNVLSGQSASAIANSLGFVGGDGLLGLMRFLKGKSPESVHASDGGVTVHRNKRSSITVTQNTYNYYVSPAMRKPVADLAATLHPDGVGSVEIGGTVIREREADFFRDSAGRRPSNVSTSSVLLRIVKLDLEGKSKWTFEGVGGKISARILDETFLDRTRSGRETFAQGDVIECNLRTLQTITDDGRITAEFEVVEVKDHARPEKFRNEPML